MPRPPLNPTLRPIRVLIADDERLMREQIRSLLLKSSPDIEVVGEARDGAEAVDAFKTLHPHVVFLDIRMPRMNGIEAARHISAACWQTPCEIVFVTAYDHHAIEAFEQGAVDYLLKPASTERIQRTLERVQNRIGKALAHLSTSLGESANPLPSSDSHYLGALLDRLEGLINRPALQRHLQYIRASIGNSIELIPVETIFFFNSDEKYTRVRTARTEALLRKSIRELLQELDPEVFWQVHRSSIVNLRAISKIHRHLDGRLQIAFDGISEKIEVSRSFTQRFRSM